MIITLLLVIYFVGVVVTGIFGAILMALSSLKSPLTFAKIALYAVWGVVLWPISWPLAYFLSVLG